MPKIIRIVLFMKFQQLEKIHRLNQIFNPFVDVWVVVKNQMIHSLLNCSEDLKNNAFLELASVNCTHLHINFVQAFD